MKKGGVNGQDIPLLCSRVAIDVARRRQRVGARRLVLDDLSSPHVRTDDGRVSHDFRAPFAVDEAFDAQYPPRVRSDAHVPVAFDR